MTLNRNPENWFTDIEQAAFSPSNMVRGIAPSPDSMLQARMFAYPDAARYRLGVNYTFLPTNAAVSGVNCPIERDGFMNFGRNYGGEANYIGTRVKPLKFREGGGRVRMAGDGDGKGDGEGVRTTLDYSTAGLPTSCATEVTERDFEQARGLWGVMGKQEGARERFVGNVAAHVAGVERGWIREEAYGMLFEEIG